MVYVTREVVGPTTTFMGSCPPRSYSNNFCGPSWLSGRRYTYPSSYRYPSSYYRGYISPVVVGGSTYNTSYCPSYWNRHPYVTSYNPVANGLAKSLLCGALSAAAIAAML